MTVWCHLPTILKQRHALRLAGLLTLCVALITTLLFADISRAAPGINRTLSFQGRLLSSSGAVVADGHYNIEFKIYQDGNSSGVGGSLEWTESYVNNNNNQGVEVKNGYFSVSLGSLNPFGSQVDWNQDTLWLSMNIAGKANNCTSFGGANCAADGEMLPMKRITSTPYALNSGAVGGKTANDLVQLGQGAQEDSTNMSSIFINKTGSGNLLHLQKAGEDVLKVDNDGDLLFGGNANHYIGIETSAADNAGRQLMLEAGAGGSGTGANGGDLVLKGGGAGGTNGNGGNLYLDAGAGTGSGNDGIVTIGTTHASSIIIGSTYLGINQNISIGANDTAGSVSNITIGAGSSADSGSTTIRAKNDVTIQTNGTTRATFSDTSNTVFFGNGSSSATPNDFTLQATNSSANGIAGGSLKLQGGNAAVGDTNGGNLILSGGTGNGTGTNGLVVLGTAAFQTTDDANCYTSGAAVASSCTISTASINNSAAILVGFSATGQTATVPDPTIVTAGRVVYVTASNGSKDFTLSMNGGARKITMRENTTTTLMWNGSDWTVAGTAASSAFRDTRDSISGTQSVVLGDGTDTDEVTLLTLDKSSTAPAVNDDALLGSMYYDTTLGKVQCYEADGWGACGAAPDTFVTLSPEYAGAVIRSDGTGTMSTDLCSDALNINDGSSSQPTICGTNETQNFYKWTSAETTDQTRSIYVTYQLPTNFKNFVAGTTSLMGRTDHTDSAITYQIYRNNSTSGLTECTSSPISASTGNQTTWQKVAASSADDPANCDFEAGDSIVVRINLTTKNNHNAYISNLGFVYSSN